MTERNLRRLWARKPRKPSWKCWNALTSASASKGDLRETELRLLKEIDGVRLEIQKAKAETIKWVAGIITAQTVAIIAAIIALMK